MAESAYRFRTALQGFNRLDVIQFVEKMTTRHETQLRQLQDENRRLQQDLDSANARLALIQASAAQPAAPSPELQAQELAAYRRAESAERVARERAEELLHSIDDAIRAGSSQLTESDTMLEQACAQLSDNIAALQQAVAAARSSLDAVRSQMQTLNADPEA